MRRAWVLWLLLALPGVSAGEELLMARIARPFPEAMNALQETIRAGGYTISRVQRVDIGLTSSGFQTAEYRIVFYGRPNELRDLARSHVELIPYLPLNIVIFAEGDESIVLTANPRQLGEFFDKPELKKVFDRWERDTRALFDTLSRAP